MSALLALQEENARLRAVLESIYVTKSDTDGVWIHFRDKSGQYLGRLIGQQHVDFALLDALDFEERRAQALNDPEEWSVL